MAKQSDFNSFLSNIQPSKSTVEYISSIQKNMRKYLKEHSTYKNVHVDTFLSGSYAKNTSIRPVVGDNKRDVDIVVVTSYDCNKNSKEVLNELKDVLMEKETYSNATLQSHSVGVEMSGISVDVVPVIIDADDETLYCIGDSNTGEWILTDPKGHKEWSTEVNLSNNKEYKPLVKIFKWWRRNNCPEDIKYPKGITLEKIVADNLGDSSLSTEDFLIATMQNIISAYKEEYVENNVNPKVNDPSTKIDDNDLLAGYSEEDFSEFILKLEEHVKILNDEGVGNEVWRKILGNEFPSASSENNLYALACVQKCITAPHKQLPKWPIQRGSAAFISLKATDINGQTVEYENNGTPLEKNCSLIFRALTSVKQPYRVVWQIVNTGIEAENGGCLRGGFEESDIGTNGKREATAYTGSHSVQCFIIKRGVCVAKSKEFIINIR